MRSIWLCLWALTKLIGANTLTWSKSYNYQAVMTIPNTDVVEPYEVWYDGTTGKTRVDYYNGVVKFYRLRWYSMLQIYDYYKIYAETTSNTTNEQVCQRIKAENFNIYDRYTYLPSGKNYTFQGIEEVNGIVAQKWKALDHKHLDGFEITYSYTVWCLNFTEEFHIPLRYEYKASVGKVVLGHINHDYERFSAYQPDKAVFVLPSGLLCSFVLPEYEPYDPLLEYIHPTNEHARVSRDFEKFKTAYGKTYKDPEENFMRMNNFRRNLRFINSQNRKLSSFSLAVNHLADTFEDEMTVYYGTDDDIDDDDLNYYDFITENNETSHKRDIPSFDWRKYDAVSPVKDQTPMCGSCYAFSTAAAVESTLYIQRGFKKMLEVSEQAIIDCSWRVNEKGNYGCRGGTLRSTLIWIKEHGIPYRDGYGRYLALEGLCHASEAPRRAHISDFFRAKKNEDEIKWYLRKNGPLVVAVDASPTSFSFYSKGLYDDKKCKRGSPQNHAMALIGYGEEDGKRFWILKNSYGQTWGEDGYIRIAIDGNICGVMTNAYGVLLNSTTIN